MVSTTRARGTRALLRGMLIGGVAALCMAAHAAVVVPFTSTALGGSLWRLDYTLQGGAPAGGFDGITVYFEPGSYGLLANAAAPSGWDVLVAQPDSVIPADGFFDLLNLGGLLTGDVGTVAFSFDVEYLGAGAPGSQRFELYQASPNFRVVATGDTMRASSVPEPATAALLCLGLGGLTLRGRLANRAQRKLRFPPGCEPAGNATVVLGGQA